MSIDAMNIRCQGISHTANGSNGIVLTHNDRAAEVRPLKNGNGHRFRAPGRGWTSGEWSLKGGLRRARRALKSVG